MGDVIEVSMTKLNFLADIETVINRYSKENDSNTPDFLLAAYIKDCLDIWARYTQLRDRWYGVRLEPGNSHFE